MVLSSDLTSLDLYLAVIVNGILTGLGVAIGTYIAQKYSIKKFEKLLGRIKKLEQTLKEKTANHFKEIHNHKKRIEELEETLKQKKLNKTRENK